MKKKMWQDEQEDNQYYETEENTDYQTEEHEEEEEIVEEYEDSESAYDLDQDEQTIVNQATLRLEQAELYKMLLKHDLFQNVEVHPMALKKVEDEIKTYIVERLEILLGIKNDKRTSQVNENYTSPFNDVEVSFLKDLAFKGTKGESNKGAAKSNEFKPVVGLEKPSINPINQPTSNNSIKKVDPVPNSNHLVSRLLKKKPKIENNPPAPRREAVREQRYEQPVKKKIIRKIVRRPVPNQRPRYEVKNAPDERMLANTKIGVAKKVYTADQLARLDLDRMSNRKKISEMNDKELLDMNKKIRSSTNTNNRPRNAIPIPNGDMMYANAASHLSALSRSGDEFTKISTSIAGGMATEAITKLNNEDSDNHSSY